MMEIFELCVDLLVGITAIIGAVYVLYYFRSMDHESNDPSSSEQSILNKVKKTLVVFKVSLSILVISAVVCCVL